MGSTPNMQVELQQGETVLKESRANLQTDFIMSQGGRLFLTNKRFIFLPARFSIPISAQKAEGIILDLARIKVVEKRKGDMSNLLAGSFRNRLHIRCQDRSLVFQVWDINAWISSIKEVIANVRT